MIDDIISDVYEIDGTEEILVDLDNLKQEILLRETWQTARARMFDEVMINIISDHMSNGLDVGETCKYFGLPEDEEKRLAEMWLKRGE